MWILVLLIRCLLYKTSPLGHFSELWDEEGEPHQQSAILLQNWPNSSLHDTRGPGHTSLSLFAWVAFAFTELNVSHVSYLYHKIDCHFLYFEFTASNKPCHSCQVSKMLPAVFDEQVIRVYCKKRDVKTVEAAKKHFAQWCKNKKFSKPTVRFIFSSVKNCVFTCSVNVGW